MTKFFINQNELSDKFWKVEVDKNVQKVTYGKIGSAGKVSEKEFPTEEICLQETEKLIKQKQSKGYIAWEESQPIPVKADVSEEEKAEVYFWQSIEKANKWKHVNWQGYDAEEHIDNLIELLSKAGKPKLILFEKVLQEKLNQLYTAEIAALSFILDGPYAYENGVANFDDYLSDDGFIYFRCWLLLQGKSFFEAITKDINSCLSGKYKIVLGECWAERLLKASEEAYGVTHDNEELCKIDEAMSALYPNVIHYDSLQNEMANEPVTGTELQEKYPELVAKALALRES
ncbi:molybdenum metabolism regulator [Siphonobacter sp. BAB-5385]|uniref:DUF4240 domain-containing protein n=1 Tax=Siphonobacter sp. BAB-5385 TaxID=1864822 RepID=UPI000B9E4F36|nr:DUF4240 domain-containing protein [Siphonobacter sp. BAB-5385]OZI09003.1 molybdenum metabolism regulator [Siphonobacter sp. BAB-5385]